MRSHHLFGRCRVDHSYAIAFRRAFILPYTRARGVSRWLCCIVGISFSAIIGRLSYSLTICRSEYRSSSGILFKRSFGFSWSYPHTEPFIHCFFHGLPYPPMYPRGNDWNACFFCFACPMLRHRKKRPQHRNRLVRQSNSGSPITRSVPYQVIDNPHISE